MGEEYHKNENDNAIVMMVLLHVKYVYPIDLEIMMTDQNVVLSQEEVYETPKNRVHKLKESNNLIYRNDPDPRNTRQQFQHIGYSVELATISRFL